MNVKKIAAVGVIAAALIGVSATSGFAASPSTAKGPAPSTCLPGGHDDVWPLWTNGQPSRDPGVRIWHDGTGWHVRVTHNTLHDRVFSGEIVTTGTLTNVNAVRLEKSDYLKVGPGRHTVAFRFNNYGGVDGFNFTTHCAPFLQFGFSTDGHIVPVARISIGTADRHPAHDPFAINRTA